MLTHRQSVDYNGRRLPIPAAEPLPLTTLRIEVVHLLYHPDDQSYGYPSNSKHDLFRRYCGTFGETASGGIAWPFEPQSLLQATQTERAARRELGRAMDLEPREFPDAVAYAHDAVPEVDSVKSIQTQLKNSFGGPEVDLPNDPNLYRSVAKEILKVAAWSDIIKEQTVFQNVTNAAYQLSQA